MTDAGRIDFRNCLYESVAALAHLERVYALMRLEVNGYLPVMKLVDKAWRGAQVTKRYGIPATPSAAP